MGGNWKLALVLAMGLALAGCGSGDSTTVAEREERQYPWLKGPTREFLVPKGDNAVQTFGREATRAQREQASEVIEVWMRARAAKDWKKDCGYFSRRFAKEITEDANNASSGKAKTCPQALAYFGPQASGDFKHNNFGDGPVVSLRIGEGHGYAQYHGNDGKDWIVPVEFEKDGLWMISTAKPLNRLR